MFDKQMFAKRLKELRETKGLNQRELAAKIDVSNGSISYYEKCQRLPDIETAYKLSEFFGVSSDYLLGLSDVKSKDTNIQATCNYTGLNQEAIQCLHKRTQSLNNNSQLKNNVTINDYEINISDEEYKSMIEYNKSYTKDYYIFLNTLILELESSNFVELAADYCRYMDMYANDDCNADCELTEFRFLKSCSGLLNEMYECGVFHDEEEDENADD